MMDQILGAPQSWVVWGLLILIFLCEVVLLVGTLSGQFEDPRFGERTQEAAHDLDWLTGWKWGIHLLLTFATSILFALTSFLIQWGALSAMGSALSGWIVGPLSLVISLLLTWLLSWVFRDL